jgi:hypothetical protein
VNGLNEARPIGAIPEQTAEPPHADLQDPLGDGDAWPDRREQLLVRQEPPRARRQVGEQRAVGGAERDALVAAHGERLRLEPMAET